MLVSKSWEISHYIAWFVQFCMFERMIFYQFGQHPLKMCQYAQPMGILNMIVWSCRPQTTKMLSYKYIFH